MMGKRKFAQSRRKRQRVKRIINQLFDDLVSLKDQNTVIQIPNHISVEQYAVGMSSGTDGICSVTIQVRLSRRTQLERRPS